MVSYLIFGFKRAVCGTSQFQPSGREELLESLESLDFPLLLWETLLEELFLLSLDPIAPLQDDEDVRIEDEDAFFVEDDEVFFTEDDEDTFLLLLDLIDELDFTVIFESSLTQRIDTPVLL